MVHGPRPKFKATLTPGSARMVLVNHYTTTPGLAAAGVTEMRWNSKRPRKRRAELLSLRSAFVGFFLEEWLRHGGEWGDGIEALRGYPFERVRVKLARHRSRTIRLAAIRGSWGIFGFLRRTWWRYRDRK